CTLLDNEPPPPISAATATPESSIPTDILATASPSPAPQSTAPTVTALPDPSRVAWTIVHTDLARPVDLQHAGGERLFLVEQAGRIRLAEGGQIQHTPYLDIRDRVNSSATEQGLLGLAFHSDIAANGFFYVNYTATGGDTFVSRFQANPLDATVDAGTETILLNFEQPFPNHNGGGMVFGPEGYLYIATGDGGSAGDPFGNGQSVETLLGKILRIDVNAGSPYGIPPDNPFAQGGGRPEIWAYGLRNPWRFAFDPANDDLYIGDVGQGDWEEIDYQEAGLPGGVNYGWNFREGAHAYQGEPVAGLVDPVAEYSHDYGCSVTGGVVVRDPSLPEWQGVYLYADYCSGIVWGLLRTPEGEWLNDILFRTEFRASAFGVDLQGRVFLLDLQGQTSRLEAIP
ncbi:MAG: PQQ-dependent sugar dehydrogenase, partial [Anaerolineales bacterium]